MKPQSSTTRVSVRVRRNYQSLPSKCPQRLPKKRVAAEAGTPLNSSEIRVKWGANFLTLTDEGHNVASHELLVSGPSDSESYVHRWGEIDRCGALTGENGLLRWMASRLRAVYNTAYTLDMQKVGTRLTSHPVGTERSTLCLGFRASAISKHLS